MSRAIMLSLYLSGHDDPMHPETAIYNNILPAIRRQSGWTASFDEKGILIAEDSRGNQLHFEVVPVVVTARG